MSAKELKVQVDSLFGQVSCITFVMIIIKDLFTSLVCWMDPKSYVIFFCKWVKCPFIDCMDFIRLFRNKW